MNSKRAGNNWAERLFGIELIKQDHTWQTHFLLQQKERYSYFVGLMVYLGFNLMQHKKIKTIEDKGYLQIDGISYMTILFIIVTTWEMVLPYGA